MAEACLGCGTKTDSNGDLTISGARSSVWKPAYGTNIDANNGLRCDPATGKLWTAPPTKSYKWTVYPGAWIPKVRSAISFEGYYYTIGSAVTTSVWTPDAADLNAHLTKVYTAAEGVFSWTNPTNQKVMIDVSTQSKVGVQCLRSGSTVTRAAAGIETKVQANNGVYIASTLETYVSSWFGYAEHGTTADLAKDYSVVLDPGQQVIVSIRPYYRTGFDNVNFVQAYWGLKPVAIVTATTLLDINGGLDLV